MILSCRRWLDILLLSAFAAVAFFAFGQIVPYTTRAILPLYLLPSWMALCAVALVTAAVMFPLVSVLQPSWRQVRTLFRYPPSWMAALVGTLLAYGIDERFGIGPRYGGSVWVGGVVGMIAIFIASASYLRVFVNAPQAESRSRRHGKRNGTPDAGATPLITPISWDNLQKWVTSERPVSDPEDDLFEYRRHASRIARLLVNAARRGERVAVGLIGPFGSGKTTLADFVKTEVQAIRKSSDPQIWICRVSCWGFDDSLATLQHILDEAVAILNRQVDCVGLRSLPDAYRRTLAAGGSWWHVLAEGFSADKDPTKQLKRLVPILKATHGRLILVIEDVDRNPARTFDHQHIQAMLHRLQDIPHVGFVLSAGSTVHNELDFAKLVDHIEVMPRLDPGVVLSVVRDMRKRCMLESSFIDPANPSAREKFANRFLSHEKEAKAAFAGLGLTLESTALLSLLTTPRALKHVLRRTLRAWDALKGEIDFDDMLLANTLRYGAPEAFNFILDEIDALRLPPARGPQGRSEDHRFKSQKERLEAKWAATVRDSGWSAESARQLLCELLPGAKRYFGDLSSAIGVEDRPQGVRVSGPVDYWQRLLNEEVNSGQIPDQQALEAMRAAMAGKPDELAERLANDEQFTRLWEHFADFLEPSSLLLDIAQKVIDLLVSQHGRDAAGDHFAMLALWRQAHRRVDHSSSTNDWLVARIKEVAPKSIRLCNDLYYYWASSKYGIVPDSERPRIREAFVTALREAFQDHPGSSIENAFSTAYPYSLYHLVFPPDAEGPPSILREPSDWPWIAPLILDAGTRAPDVMVPQLALLVGQQKENWDRGALARRYVVDAERVIGIFGERARDLYRSLTTEVKVADRETQFYLDEARRQAHERLMEIG